MVKVYTKTGDKGETALFGGTRIAKDSDRVDTYGTIDRVNVSIGLAKAHIHDQILKDLLEICQLKLFEMAAEVASDPQGLEKLGGRLDEKDVTFLEEAIDELFIELDEKKYFSVPGQSVESAFLHKARVDVREAERKLIALGRKETINEFSVKFLNRLSDLMFTISRYVDEVEPKNSSATGSKKLVHAREIEQACLKKAEELNVPMAVAITDKHGALISFGVMDDTLDVSYELAIDKAFTAAQIRKETSELSKITRPGDELYGLESRERFVVFGGGIPLFSDGQLVAAIGVSGGSVEEDIQVAKAGEKAFLGGDKK